MQRNDQTPTTTSTMPKKERPGASVSDVTPRQQQITLGSGERLILMEPTLLDFRDFEKLTGKEWYEMFSAEDDRLRISMTELGILLWCMVRKTGVTEAQQVAGTWAITLDEFLARCTVTDFTAMQEHVGGFLSPDGPIRDG